MSSVTRRMTARPSGRRCTSTVAEPGGRTSARRQVAERQAGELGRLVPEDLGRGLAPVVALQQHGEVVGLAAGGETALGAELRPGGVGGAVEQLTLLVAGRLERGQLGQRASRGAAVRLADRGLRRETGGARHAPDATAPCGARHCDAASVTDPWLRRGSTPGQRSSSRSAAQPTRARIRPPISAVTKPSTVQPIGEQRRQAEQGRVDDQQEQAERQHHERQGQQPAGSGPRSRSPRRRGGRSRGRCRTRRADPPRWRSTSSPGSTSK